MPRHEDTCHLLRHHNANVRAPVMPDVRLMIDVLHNTADDPRGRIYAPEMGGLSPYLPLLVAERLLKLFKGLKQRLAFRSEQVHIFVLWTFGGIAPPQWIKDCCAEMAELVENMIVSWEECEGVSRVFLPRIKRDMSEALGILLTLLSDAEDGDDKMLEDFLSGIRPTAAHHIGATVELHSLSKEAMNGKQGVVLTHDEVSGRAGVQVAGSKEPVAIKVCNLKLISVAPKLRSGPPADPDVIYDGPCDDDEEEEQVEVEVGKEEDEEDAPHIEEDDQIAGIDETREREKPRIIEVSGGHLSVTRIGKGLEKMNVKRETVSLEDVDD